MLVSGLGRRIYFWFVEGGQAAYTNGQCIGPAIRLVDKRSFLGHGAANEMVRNEILENKIQN